MDTGGCRIQGNIRNNWISDTQEDIRYREMLDIWGYRILGILDKEGYWKQWNTGKMGYRIHRRILGTERCWIYGDIGYWETLDTGRYMILGDTGHRMILDTMGYRIHRRISGTERCLI